MAFASLATTKSTYVGFVRPTPTVSVPAPNVACVPMMMYAERSCEPAGRVPTVIVALVPPVPAATTSAFVHEYLMTP